MSFHELEDRTLLSTIMWDATDHPTGGSWDDATNWVGGVLPGPTNQVVIDLSGTGTVTLGNGVTDTVNSLTTNSHTSISISGDTLSLATSSTIGGGLGVTSGSVAINSGTLTLDGGGSDSGTISVLGSSTLDLASSYEVAATGKVIGTGSVTLASGTLTLDPGHTFDVTGGLTAAGGSATFGTGDTLGPVISASGGSVTFGVGTNLPALTSVTESGGSLNFSTGSGISIATISLTGGTLGGSDTITVSGTATWTNANSGSGSISGTGTFIASSTSTLNITAYANDGSVTLSGETLENFGTATLQGTIGGNELVLQGGATIINEPHGTWSLATGPIAPHSSSSGGTFNNEGGARHHGHRRHQRDAR